MYPITKKGRPFVILRLYGIIKLLLAAFLAQLALSEALLADPVYHPSGPRLTFGGMTHRELSVSDMGNPAHPAIDPLADSDGGRYALGFSVGVGVEYDANDNLWENLDDAASDDALAPGGDNGDDESGESGPTIPDITNPDLIALIEEVEKKAKPLAVAIAASVTGLNAKAFTSANLPVLISNDALGGSWTFNANTSITTNIKGLSEPIEFDSTVALQELERAYRVSTLKTGLATEPETFDLTGGLAITINPDGSTEFSFSNNSGTITRAAHITELGVGYSRKIWSRKDNDIYIGIKPKFYRVGLSDKYIFLDNIDDAESIFNALDKESFDYTEKLSLDIGAIWTGKQYQFGVTLTNINEPDFQYPGFDVNFIDNPEIVDLIIENRTYTMERQLKLEGGYISKSGAWGINAGIDLNAVPDPMFDDYQWISLGAGFASDNWWLPGARIGVRTNLAGSEFTYLTAGVTVFNIINLDLATTTETITVDGDKVPQGLIVNLGFQYRF
jgi:hypothetical protein